MSPVAKPGLPIGLGEPERLAQLADPLRKQAYVTPMFDRIAPRYDDFTRSFSLGMDRGWKRRMVDEAIVGLPPRSRVLDLACGTGDFAALVAEALPLARALGIDIAPQMIAMARQRHRRHARIRFALGDMMRLPVTSGSIDLVTVGYGLRNVPDHRVALREIVRVLRPDGRLAVLDFTRPRCAPWRWLYLGYLRLAGDCYGWRWHREPAVYGYISRSVAHFLSGTQLATETVAAGLRLRRRRSHLLGGILELQAERP